MFIHAISVARAIWNNLLEPVGAKSSTFSPSSPFLCPTDDQPYLATAKNSARRMENMKLFAKDYTDMMTRTGPVACPL
jgi:hypothetical protein